MAMSAEIVKNCMKKRLYKLVALGLCVATVGGPMAMPVFAAPGDRPAEGDTANVIIRNVEDGATVTAYQIVDATYDTQGLTGYETVNGVTIKDIEHPTAKEITTIAKTVNNTGKPLGEGTTLTGNKTNGYKADLGAGTWLVIAKGADGSDIVYNPMIVSVDYTNANEADSITAGTVDSNGKFQPIATDAAAYAKQSVPTVDKKITNYNSNTNEGATGKGNASGDSLGVKVGDTVDYEVDTQLPSFSDSYKDPKFGINDTLSNGLTLIDDYDAADTTKTGGFTVKVGETPLSRVETISADTKNSYCVSKFRQDFLIKISEDVLRAHQNDETLPDVVVTYSAKINNQALVSDLAIRDNPNDVKLLYTTNPDDGPEDPPHDGPSDKTHQYTFALPTIYKTDKDGAADATTPTDGVIAAPTLTDTTKGLKDAVFTFTMVEDEDGTAVNKDMGDLTSAEGGLISADHLDAGTYTLKEKTAPNGYTLNDTTYTIKIVPTFDADGNLTEYTTTVTNDKNSDTETTTIKAGAEAGKVTDDSTAGATIIKDSSLQRLPSTGGAGTIAITLIASAGMAGFLTVHFANKKKKLAE